jgi:rhomboid family protein
MFPVSDVIPSRTTPYVTICLISANALAFLYELQLPPDGLEQLVQRYGVIPASFTWPTVLSSLFFHIGWIHVLGNTLALWIFGDNLEGRLGHARFAIFYVVCGAAAARGQAAMQPFSTVPMIGASGAIAGIMGAYFVIFPQSRVLTAVFAFVFYDLIEVPAGFFLGIWFLLQFFSGVGSLVASAADGGVALWAHVVGFGTGALAGGLWRVAESRRRRGWEY